MATPTKCEEKRPEGANPRTGYRARLLGKETYTAPGGVDNRDARGPRNGAERKKKRRAPSPRTPHEKDRGHKAPAKRAPSQCEKKTRTQNPQKRQPQKKKESGGGREGSWAATQPAREEGER